MQYKYVKIAVTDCNSWIPDIKSHSRSSKDKKYRK